MAAAPAIPVLPERLDTTLQLICSEEWGGNRTIDAPIRLPGIQGRLYSRPCGGGRGGDVHYLAVCGAGLLSRLWISDVVGHGEAVAKVSEEIHDLLRQYMNQPDHRRVLTKLNHRLEQIGLGAMTTVAAATYYSVRRRLSISYAGHPPGWYYDKIAESWSRLEGDPPDKKPQVLTDGPLAVQPNVAYTSLERSVTIGDRLLFITDGVLEAPDASGELYGVEPLTKLLHDHRYDDADRIARIVLDALTERVGDAGFVHDDVTLLLVEFVPGPKPPAMWHMMKNMVLRPRGNSDDPIFADRR